MQVESQRAYVEQLEAHMDEGGTVTNANVRELIELVNGDVETILRVRDLEICPACKGNGYVRKDKGIEQCSACNSKGELDVAL